MRPRCRAAGRWRSTPWKARRSALEGQDWDLNSVKVSCRRPKASPRRSHASGESRLPNQRAEHDLAPGATTIQPLIKKRKACYLSLAVLTDGRSDGQVQQ